MSDMDTQNPRSTARIAGHPLHPMIIPFPIAFFVSAFVTDLIYLSTGRPGFAAASVWLLGAGVAGALLAAVLGFTDFLGEPRIRAKRQAWLHMGGNLLAVLLEIWNLALRAGGAPVATGGETLLSGLVVLLLLFNGWVGWELVYRGHVGVMDDGEAASVRHASMR